MLVGARHTIHDPQAFWSSAQENMSMRPGPPHCTHELFSPCGWSTG